MAKEEEKQKWHDMVEKTKVLNKAVKDRNKKQDEQYAEDKKGLNDQMEALKEKMKMVQDAMDQKDEEKKIIDRKRVDEDKRKRRALHEGDTRAEHSSPLFGSRVITNSPPFAKRGREIEGDREIERDRELERVERDREI